MIPSLVTLKTAQKSSKPPSKNRSTSVPTNMPTPSRQVQSPKSKLQSLDSDWAARPAQPPRSIFRNYQAVGGAALQSHASHQSHKSHENTTAAAPLQSAIDAALARSVVYRFLAQAYEDPTEEGWARLVALDCPQMLEPAARILAAAAPLLPEVAAAL